MTWTVDSSHSQVTFGVRHLMIHTVRGQFRSFEIDVDFDDKRPELTRIEARIEAASITTNMDRRDDHLRSADFLDAANYPYLHFKSKRVELKDARHARLIGDLTIRGVTREVSLEVEYAGTMTSPWGTTHAGFSATTRIDRRNWGLVWNQLIEGSAVLVGDEVTIAIELELVRQPETEAAAIA
jgi:polyisoprenoid-binding protein YceI